MNESKYDPAYNEGTFDFSNVKDRDILKLVETIFNISFRYYSENVIDTMKSKFDAKFNQTGIYKPELEDDNEQD